MKTRDYTAANLEAWQEVADLHREQNLAQLKVDFSRPGHSCLKEVDTTRLLALGVAGKDVAQICCNNGRELVSVKNLGAARCVGFDGAVGFIEQAREINDAANQDCEFACCDIHDIDPAFNEAFDIIQITIGVIGWMPDLDAFFDPVARLARPGGAVFIHEQHPTLEMIEPGEADPWVENDGLDYYGHTKIKSKTRYSFPHTMAAIIMACVNRRMDVEFFEEYPTHISDTRWNVEKQGPELPMSYALVVRNRGSCVSGSDA